MYKYGFRHYKGSRYEIYDKDTNELYQPLADKSFTKDEAYDKICELNGWAKKSEVRYKISKVNIPVCDLKVSKDDMEKIKNTLCEMLHSSEVFINYTTIREEVAKTK